MLDKVQHKAKLLALNQDYLKVLNHFNGSCHNKFN